MLVQAAVGFNPQRQDQVQVISKKFTGATDAAADVLGEILVQANESLARVREVVHATAQQASTATDIAQRVEHIASMAEETNATMQNNAVDAVELDRIAGTLRTQVSAYRV